MQNLNEFFLNRLGEGYQGYFIGGGMFLLFIWLSARDVWKDEKASTGKKLLYSIYLIFTLLALCFTAYRKLKGEI